MFRGSPSQPSAVTTAPPSTPPAFVPLQPQPESFSTSPRLQASTQSLNQPPQLPYSSPPNPRKRKAPEPDTMLQLASAPVSGYANQAQQAEPEAEVPPQGSTPKKSRTNTPWTQVEEQRLKTMREAGNSWSEIAKGSVKKHWYKAGSHTPSARRRLTEAQDMHYADFAEDESAALLAAIKEYEASKWKVIGAKVGKPAKACEQYAKEHFAGRI
ncbi:hypothetical protein Q9189_006597 [Teloschistes chrysophthalmus]